MSWLLDWLLRTAQDYLKNSISINNALIFISLIITFGLILKGKSILELITSTYNKLTNKSKIKDLEGSLRNLRIKIYQQLNYIVDRDEDFKVKVDTIIRQIKNLSNESRLDKNAGQRITGEVIDLQEFYKESIQDLRELIDVINSDLSDAERILSDAQSGEWTSKNAEETFRKFHAESINQQSVKK